MTTVWLSPGQQTCLCSIVLLAMIAGSQSADSISATPKQFLPTAWPYEAPEIFLDNSTEVLPNCTVTKMEEKNFLMTLATHFGKIHGHLSAIVCAFGMLANFANVIVLTRKNMANSSTNRILMWLAVADLLMFIFYFPQVIHFNLLREPDVPYLHTSSWAWIKFSEFVVSFALICHAAAVWLTVLLALFRYLYIALPTRGPALASMRNANRFSFLVFFVSVVLSVPNIIMNRVNPCAFVTYNESSGSVSRRILFEINMQTAKYPNLLTTNFWLQAIMWKIVPSILLTIFTILLIKEMRKAGKRRAALKGKNEKHSSARENRTTMMLLAIVVLFLITVLPNGILLLLSELSQQILMYVYIPLGDFLDLIALVNESINFILYTTMSQQFRYTFCEIFCSVCLPKGRSEWTTVGNSQPNTQKKLQVANNNNSQNGRKELNKELTNSSCLVIEQQDSPKTCLVVHSNMDGSTQELTSTV